ncbi:hypothetical protein [Paraliomyxa miuraensis]|uniref:hypothetical protein n=1 Tax=Paraliomyxa miuraensis TaxID=376150 RepID=UPI0022587A26|nr:hypothetical protein [Paraliomyxa miuraensis]MCX4243784.1 hypothetical protein [Paraliomyxa miuraensis]
MADASSHDLHPAHGGRFVLTRIGSGEPLEYVVAIHLPEGRRLEARLHWSDGQPRIEPALDDGWAEAETLKLARILRRTPRSSLTRWRGH